MKLVKLVFSGSGTKFPVFAGAVKRLEEEGCTFEEVIGTSGGSVAAAAIASGFTGNQFIKLCRDVMPKLNKMVDFSILRPLSDWGFIGGKAMKDELGKHFVKTLGHAKIPLYITAVNFDTEQLVIFSSKVHPDLETKSAVRASISIPVVFVPEDIMGNLYIDGGVRANFPIDYFGNSSNVIGLHFMETPYRKPRPKGWKSLFEFIARVVGILINAKADDDIEDAKGTIRIPLRSSVNGLDFSFNEKEVQTMIQEGYDCVDLWIKANPGRIK